LLSHLPPPITPIVARFYLSRHNFGAILRIAPFFGAIFKIAPLNKLCISMKISNLKIKARIRPDSQDSTLTASKMIKIG